MVPAFRNGAREAFRLTAAHAVLQQVSNAENAGQWRADLMPDKCQEACLLLFEGARIRP